MVLNNANETKITVIKIPTTSISKLMVNSANNNNGIPAPIINAVTKLPHNPQ